MCLVFSVNLSSLQFPEVNFIFVNCLVYLQPLILFVTGCSLRCAVIVLQHCVIVLQHCVIVSQRAVIVSQPVIVSRMVPLYQLASFPGPARSSLAVRNSRRGPGLVHHVMRAAAYVTNLLLESMMS